MTGNLPSGPKLDRAAVERIIQRAAELQATTDRDISDGLSEKELLGLAQDVGIPESHVRQALMEERTRSTLPVEGGLMVWLAGPRHVAAGRTIAGESHRLEAALNEWMADGELLAVKRRFPQHTTWEAKAGPFASVRRALSFGGRGYALTRAREVTAAVIPVDPARCHVQLVADVSNTVSQRLGSATAVATIGAAGSIVASTLGIVASLTFIPVLLTTVLAASILYNRHRETERVHLALEQILDQLERGEIDVQQHFRGPRPSAFVRIADELLKKALGPGDDPK